MKKYLRLVVCLFISALCFNILQKPNNIVSGGIPGLSIIITKYIKISSSLFIFIVSFILLILGYIFLGKNKIISSIASTFIYPLCIKITNINVSFTSNKILIAILIGIITGLTVGIIYKNSLNNGGISILVEIISKYSKLSIPIISFILNILIVILGYIFVGNDSIIYSSIILIINSIVIKLILSIPNKKNMI